MECLPTAIPESLELVVEDLGIGATAEAGVIALPPGVDLIDAADRVVVSVSLPRVQEEEEEEVEELLLEGDQDEPEVIGKGKEGDDTAPADDED